MLNNWLKFRSAKKSFNFFINLRGNVDKIGDVLPKTRKYTHLQFEVEDNYFRYVYIFTDDGYFEHNKLFAINAYFKDTEMCQRVTKTKAEKCITLKI